MTFYFNARDHEYQLSEQQLTQQTVGENLGPVYMEVGDPR